MSDWSRTYNGFLYPEAKILVEDKELKFNSGKKGMRVSNIHVEKSVGLEASTCLVKLKAQKTVSNGYIPAFFSDLKAFAKIEIQLGYSGTLKTVFVGYISSVDLEIDAKEDTTVTVRGMDGKALMMSNLKSEVKKGTAKYSDVVKEVFKDYTGKFSGSEIKISNEPKLNAPICQIGESDYELVCKMAAKAGALFYIDNGKFYFVDMYSGKSGNETFNKNNISKINMSINLCGIPKKVETIVQDRKHFTKTITGAASKSGDLGKGKDAAGLSKNVSGIISLKDSTITSEKEAEFTSQVEQNRRNFNMVSWKVGLMHGIPDLELAKVYNFEGIGKPVDGECMLNSVIHDMSSDQYSAVVCLNSTRYDF